MLDDMPDAVVVTLMRLVEPEQATLEDGLLVEVTYAEEENVRETVPLAQIVLPEEDRGHRVLTEYCLWFSVTSDFEPEDEPFVWQSPFPSTRVGVIFLLLRWVIYGAGLGATLGALLEVFESAYTGMSIGAGILALLGYLFLSRMAAANPGEGGPSPLVAGIIGIVLGGLVGGTLGVYFVGALGTIPGAILGSILSKIFLAFGQRPLGEFGWALLGSSLGGLGISVYYDSGLALAGAEVGALIGGLVTFAIVLLVVLLVSTLASFDEEDEPPDLG